MTTKRNNSTESTRSTGEAPLVGRRLIFWPLTLIGLTLALLFVTNTVSAWGQRDSHDLAGIQSHAEKILDHVLDRLDATDEQSTAIQSIVAATIENLHDARGDGAASLQKFRRLVLADSIDRGALEKFRQTQMEWANAMSLIVTDGLADMMAVLSSEQRDDIDEYLDEHRDRHHGHHRWGWH